MIKNCCSDREKLLKFKAEGREEDNWRKLLGLRNMQEKLEPLEKTFLDFKSGQKVYKPRVMMARTV